MPKSASSIPNRQARHRQFTVSKQDQLDSLASPVRHQLHQTMDAIGPCSVRELAERMGREPEALYYHLRNMLKSGLVIETGRRPAGRRYEAIYDVVGRPFRVDPTITRPGFLDGLYRSAAARLRLADRCLKQTIMAKRAVREGASRSFRIEQINVRLSDRNLKAYNRQVTELMSFLREHDDPDAENFYNITIASGWSENGNDEASES
ncbi:MAG: helix-turn-helix domain-containing protein [Planctomycetota bacterium]|nr:helix-turn-helix domain-containing protein [Planctomycetota bacterium]